jgi:tRNA pseudouridine55 synthase
MTKIDGWLNIYKPKGISSAKVVSLVWRELGVKRVGHAGTLDLEAEGVLPIAVGKATKLIQFAMDARKIYRFLVQFGSSTDTADASGKVIDTTKNMPAEEAAREICKEFIGEIEQIPPRYSALKVDGKRAYDLARQGVDFELKKRKITIFDLKLLSFDQELHQAFYEVTCSKGTYIRTLAEDLSLSLQSLGFVLELARTRVSAFCEEDSIHLNQNLEFRSNLSSTMQPLEIVLADIPVSDIDVDIARKVCFGQKVFLDHQDEEQIWLSFNGKVLAIGKVLGGQFYSQRVLNVELD